MFFSRGCNLFWGLERSILGIFLYRSSCHWQTVFSVFCFYLFFPNLCIFYFIPSHHLLWWWVSGFFFFFSFVLTWPMSCWSLPLSDLLYFFQLSNAMLCLVKWLFLYLRILPDEFFWYFFNCPPFKCMCVSLHVCLQYYLQELIFLPLCELQRFNSGC